MKNESINSTIEIFQVYFVGKYTKQEKAFLFSQKVVKIEIFMVFVGYTEF